MTTPQECRTVIALASALDDEAYARARSLLSPACLYRFRDEVLEGPDAIIASYQGNGEQARERFDRIEYESRVTPLSSGRARIDYTDFITLGGQTHTHRCAQEVDFDSRGVITRIKHIDLDGERESFEAFLAAHT